MTKIKYGVVAAMILAGAGVSPQMSFAAEKAQARLVAQVSEPRQVIVDGRLWSCIDDKCTSGSQGKSQPVGRECARVAKVIGPIAEYRSGDRTLDAAQVAACNAASETAARTGRATDVAANAR